MQFFPIGRVYDFMKYRTPAMGLSLLLVIGSLVLIWKPGPRLGTDFKGGTEIEVAFSKPVSASEIQDAVEKKGFSRPDVIRVEDPKNPHRFLVRVQEVSTIEEPTRLAVEKKLCFGEKQPEGCAHHATEVKFSPGGEKINVRFEAPPDLDWIRAELGGVAGIEVRASENNPVVQSVRDHRVEVALTSLGDQMMAALRAGLPEGTVPEAALRTEWIGPKAGSQLRDAALKSIFISLFFIMAYVAIRFDVRFAPGGVLALAHDAIGTIGILIVMGREINLTTVAAILTIIGFSVNDTVVIYDRVRENVGKARGATFSHLINVSLSETLSRTILTSSTVIMVLVCFFVWGTGTLQDFALALIIGLVLGVYSSIYVALPLTEALDRKLFSQSKKKSVPSGTPA